MGCTSTNKTLETHPTTENTSELKALDKFWRLLRPLRILNGAGAVDLQTVTDGGAVTDNDITLNGSNLIFEGYLENAYETTLSVVEPTGDRTILLPNSDGQVAMDGDALAYSIVFGS